MTMFLPSVTACPRTVIFLPVSMYSRMLLCLRQHRHCPSPGPVEDFLISSVVIFRVGEHRAT